MQNTATGSGGSCYLKNRQPEFTNPKRAIVHVNKQFNFCLLLPRGGVAGGYNTTRNRHSAVTWSDNSSGGNSPTEII